MSKPKTDISELQALQFQIAPLIDKYRTEPGSEKLVMNLKKAVTALNDAKCIIFDNLVTDGTLKPADPEETKK